MGKKGEDATCPSCGDVQKAKTTISLKEKIIKKNELEIIENNSTVKMHPLVDTVCPKCKHSRAHFWTKQTRAGDEPETQFYQCEKCAHKWRNYS